MRHPRPSAIPRRSWIKSTRETLGLSLQALADRLDVSPQAVHQLEGSEAAGTISLGQLEKLARAMGCRLTYSLSRNMASASITKSTPVKARPARTAQRAPAKAARPSRSSPSAPTAALSQVALPPAPPDDDGFSVLFSVTSD
ncbi:MAG TPA: helix-turn-helix domain-containing protein [Opitutaceae bacterium]|nr:helix-turn-helix domain-containing protein [Opitutaceae bacterium]